jgi:hypothetical protein
LGRIGKEEMRKQWKNQSRRMNFLKKNQTDPLQKSIVFIVSEQNQAGYD